MTTTQQDSSSQVSLVTQVLDYWQDLIEDDSEENITFAEALKGWFDNQMQELHDSRGDAEYQQDTIKELRAFRTMIQQVKDLEFGMADLEADIALETLPEDLYMKALKDRMKG